MLCVVATAVAEPLKIPQLPVYVEDSQAAQDLIEQAEGLRAQDRLAEAATVYQQVIDQFPDKLLSGGASGGVKIYRDAPGQVFEELVGDADLLAAYRRLEEPAAQAALAAAGTDTALLHGVIAHYRACEAGLKAGLLVAGLELERGNPTDAGAVLDDLQGHPDLATVAARWRLLEAAVGVFGDDPARLIRYEAALRDTPEGATLAAWTAGHQRVAGTPVWDGLEPMPAVALPKDLSQPLWRIELPDSIAIDSARANFARFNGVSPNDRLGRRRCVWTRSRAGVGCTSTAACRCRRWIRHRAGWCGLTTIPIRRRWRSIR